MRGVFLIGIIIAFVIYSSNAEVSITVERIVDLTTQFADEGIYYEVRNEGGSLSSFNFAVENENLVNMNVYKVSDKTGDNNEIIEKLSAIKYEMIKTETHNGISYDIIQVTFESPLSSNTNALVKVSASYAHKMSPKPKTISQIGDFPRMVYSGNVYVPSEYNVVRQVTEYRTVQVVSYNEDLQPNRINAERQIVTFGPFSDVSGFNYSPCSIHFYTNAKYLTVDNLIREIEVSHWGNIAIEETYELHHAGPALKGSFSRLDYMIGHHSNAIPEFVQRIPVNAFDVYYRDIIGNISTSHVFRHEDHVKFEITPRFVLFGGWRDEFKTGYNLPTSPFLKNDGSSFELSLPLVNVFEDAVIDNAEFRVVLPEGVSDIEISTSVSISKVEFSTRKTYLDTTGRTVLTFRAHGLVSDHEHTKLIVRYSFSTMDMFREPFFLITAYCVLFLTFILYFRSDFSITRGVTSEIDIKTQQLIREYVGLVESRSSLFQQSQGKNVAKKIEKYNNDANASLGAGQTLTSKISSVEPELGNICRDIHRASKQQVTVYRQILSLSNSSSEDTKAKVAELKGQFETAGDIVNSKLALLQ